ncbi:hypothetical protein V1292_004125 [Bradyrhizobium sp. AZCC 1719]|uniref:hypothetical protein n=1 Tax=Bradyrhizobium sp. AZCC 1719 TaxID=3117028 RepID=UPI002FF31E83
MSRLPVKPRRIWLRSFYEFSPEEDGYIGWTEEGPHDRMLGLIEDGFAFRGQPKPPFDKSVLLKIGVTNDSERRADSGAGTQ